MSWSAAQYVRFEDQRNRPIHDLLAQIPTAVVRTAIDIGCGPGNSTQLLQARYPLAQVGGLDSSADMIAAARRRLPEVEFTIGDIAAFADGGADAATHDVILANAALQWLPDHALLMPRLIDRLAPGGSLAVQMPDNLDEPAHRLMREIAADGPWAEALAGAASLRAPRHDADCYYRMLRGHVAALEIWRTTYHHPLADGAAGIVDWFRGSGLRPFLDPLDEVGQSAFLARYAAAVATAYPAMADGSVLLPFPRLFIVAVR